MDWPYEDPDFSEKDLDNVFSYRPGRPNKAVCQFSGEADLIECELKTDAELAKWIEQVESRRQNSGLAVILATKHEQNQGKRHNPAHLQYLPFSREAFDQIAKRFPLHGDTARIINRSDFPFFTDIDLSNRPGNAIYYCCRTSGVTAGDLAVSAVFNPTTGFTSAVVLGCSPETDRSADDSVEAFAGRIWNSEDAWTHPMLIIGILVEMEKIRHFKHVEDRVSHLLIQVQAMSNAGTISSTSELTKENYSVNLWISVSRLRIALESWKVQLAKMHAHISELEKAYFTEAKDGDPDSPRSADTRGSFSSSATAIPDAKFWKQSARDTGRRTQKRLTEIMAEYDEKIRECSMVIDGMALSAQLSWNQIGYQDAQANLKIAIDTRRDSNQMRSIALLTMIFLPATFLASLFSMTFFDWKAAPGEHIISPYIWIYPVLAFGITLAVLGVWYYFTGGRRHPVSGCGDKPKKRDEEMGQVGVP